MTTMNQPIDSPQSALDGLNSDDNQIRYYAAWWLGKHQVQEACGPLCQALEDQSYRTPQGGYPLRRQAARALACLRNSEAVPALIQSLSCKEDPQLREEAIRALGVIGDGRSINPLVNLLREGGEQPYEALIEALATLEVWSVSGEIEVFLQHSSERVQCAAARYLYLLTQRPEYLERIIKNLDHENPYLRWGAAFDLGSIGHLQAAQAIIAAKLVNSLKMLNLKRILGAVLTNQGENTPDKEAEINFLIGAIDNLLIQL